MAIFDRNSQEKELNRLSPLSELSDEQLNQLIKKKQQEKQQDTLQTIGGAATGLSNIFLQKAGVGQKQPSQFDELIKQQKLILDREQAEQKFRLAESKEERETAKFETKQVDDKIKAEQDKILADKEAVLRGEKGVDTTVSTEAVPTTAQPVAQPVQPGGVPQQAGQVPGGLIETQRVIGTGDVKQTFKNLTLDLEQASIEELQAQGLQLSAGQRLSFNNFENIMGAANGFVQVFADAIEANEAGDIFKGTRTKLATQFNIPLGGGKTAQGEFAKEGSKLPGKLIEMLLKMMPMLTQQGDKPGSVRIIKSILTSLGQTIPNLNTDPEAGRGMVEETLKSFFRFARASELSGLDFDKQFNQDLAEIDDEELGAWISKINNAAARVGLGEKEEAALDNAINATLKPLDDVIKRRQQGQSQELTEIDRELAEINKQLGL